MSNGKLNNQEEEAGDTLNLHSLLCEVLAEELSEESLRIKKERERKEFNFSLYARIGVISAIFFAVAFLYITLFLIIARYWDLLQEAHQAALAALVSGIIISTTALLSFLIVGVFRNAKKDNPEHPMQSLLSNLGKILNQSGKDQQ